MSFNLKVPTEMDTVTRHINSRDGERGNKNVKRSPPKHKRVEQLNVVEEEADDI